MNWTDWFVCGWLSGIVFTLGIHGVRTWWVRRDVLASVNLSWTKGTPLRTIQSNLHAVELAIMQEMEKEKHHVGN